MKKVFLLIVLFLVLHFVVSLINFKIKFNQIYISPLCLGIEIIIFFTIAIFIISKKVKYSLYFLIIACLFILFRILFFIVAIYFISFEYLQLLHDLIFKIIFYFIIISYLYFLKKSL